MTKRMLVMAAAGLAALGTVLTAGPVFSGSSAVGIGTLEIQMKKVLENQDKILEELEEIKKELQIVKVRASLR